MTAAIAVRQLHKHFGQLHALRGVDLEIRRGEFFGLLGPNGAGKSTLINILAGLTRPDAGSAAVLGHDVQRDAVAARRAIGVVPQELVFDPFFGVRDFLMIQAGYYGVARRHRAWIDELLRALGLADKADANMRSLSGGMKRRVLIAQALVHKPQVLVLDEPTAGVDVELRQTLWAFAQRLHGEGMTIVLTTHYLEEAQALCNRVAMLKAGKVVALDSTANLIKRISGSQLVVRLASGQLPDSLKPLVTNPEQLRSGNQFTLRVTGYNDVEPILARLREGGVVIEDMQLKQADLEDVFMQIMDGDK